VFKANVPAPGGKTSEFRQEQKKSLGNGSTQNTAEGLPQSFQQQKTEENSFYHHNNVPNPQGLPPKSAREAKLRRGEFKKIASQLQNSDINPGGNSQRRRRAQKGQRGQFSKTK